MRQKRHRWQVGDVFTISTSDGEVAVGQVIGQEPDMMRSATVALFDERHPSPEAARTHGVLSPKTLFSVLFVTTNHLDSGAWPVVDHRKVAVDPRRNPYEHTRRSGFIGAIVTGANIVNEFVNALYGLVPWDDWKDPNYLDSLLVSKDVKPVGRLIYKK
jgi:hypothetical protein